MSIEPWLRELVQRVLAFESEAHQVLAVHETAQSRLVILEDTYKTLATLSLVQDELFRQALRCAENGLFRAAHVMAWAAFMDFLQEKLGADGLKKLKQIRPSWSVKTVEELRETVVEHQIVEAAKELGLCSKSEMKSLHGLLSKRNECAHPSAYYPALNETIGYISELLQRLANIDARAT